MKILVLGATGMLGSAMVRLLGSSDDHEVMAATRAPGAQDRFPKDLRARFFSHVDAENPDSLAGLFASAKPDVVVNCVGLVKQLDNAKDVMAAIPLNTLLPHRLLALCESGGARLIHVSTDCVFSGRTGGYRETDQPDASDVYGLSKYLGEVGGARAITLRTSIIGHELRGRHSLLEWFLAQEDEVDGFTGAIFSGVPTVELARIVRDFVLPRPDLHGLYHVSAAPIAKYDLLRLIAGQYDKRIEIRPKAEPAIDRSLDSSRFRAATGYEPPDWPELVARMHRYG